MSRYQVETLVGVLVLLAIVALLVGLVRRIKGGSAKVTVSEEIGLPGAAAAHAAELAVGLRSLRGARLEESGMGRYVLVVRRSPSWTLAFLPLFGLGFILALLFSEQWRLTVSLDNTHAGARVRLEGATEQRLLGRVRAVIASSAGAAV